MSVTFNIPGVFRGFAAGKSQVEVGQTVTTLSEALEALWAQCPGMRDRVITEQGLVREHISVFIGSEDVRYLGGLTARVPPGAEISIVPAVSGGLESGPRGSTEGTGE
jgi:molybdopterin synthase sulfur carrier subunit